MTQARRQALFDSLLSELARARARRLRLVFAGTIRKLPPPPLPGEASGATRYFVNTLSADGARAGLAELGAASDERLRRAEAWVATGRGAPPTLPRKAKIKR